MNNDDKIAEWACLLKITGQPYGPWAEVPNFTESDTSAITLLPILVERGYSWKLKHMDKEVQCWITIPHMTAPIFYAIKPTIAGAITAAVLQLIGETTNE
jgi:hypothetical protein